MIHVCCIMFSNILYNIVLPCTCRWHRTLEEPFHCGWQWIVWSFSGQMDCWQRDTIQILDIHGADINTSFEKTEDCDERLQFLQYCHFYNKYNRTALNWHKHYNINYVPFTLCTYTLVCMWKIISFFILFIKFCCHTSSV